MKDEKETCLPDRQVCNECGVSVKFGSGHFVNRVPDLNDPETRLEMGKPFPNGEWICSKCDNENTFQLSEESAEPSVTISDLCKIWNELYGENFKKEYQGVYKRITNTF